VEKKRGAQERRMLIYGKLRAIGREGIVSMNGLQISVIIREARQRMENVDYLIEPTAGVGSVWVDSDEVKIVGEAG
jgi:hypothetical protein